MQAVKAGKRVVSSRRARAWELQNLGAGREFGRKVRTLSGNYQLVQIAPWLLTKKKSIRFRLLPQAVATGSAIRLGGSFVHLFFCRALYRRHWS